MVARLRPVTDTWGGGLTVGCHVQPRRSKSWTNRPLSDLSNLWRVGDQDELLKAAVQDPQWPERHPTRCELASPDSPDHPPECAIATCRGAETLTTRRPPG